MDKVTGYVTGVNGNLVAATFSGSVRKNEVGYVLVGDDRLKGEVIRVNGDTASMQIYEMTNGIQVGDKVELSGELMSVELGPGLLTQVFDGLQNPLPELAQQCGFFLQRGVYLDPIPNKDWEFTPLVKPGDHVTAGDAVGSVPEGLFTHLIMVPFGLKDEGWRVKSVREKGVYNVRDTVAVLENDNGEEKELTMVFSWPVKQPIRCYEERLRPDETLVTKLRSIDTFLPVAKGGTFCVPGPFGAGKTVLQHMEAKNADVDIVIVAACGERAGEVVEVLKEFPELVDPRTGESLMKRTVLIANTSDMPVAAREASIYTGITIAEYFRDMGYDVAVLADSTSRWAEALREMSGRLEEMPGEEGYPAYLASRIAQFYERAGCIRCIGSEGDRRGSVTAIGAVSPPGGDISEPVSQATMRIVKVFWALDSSLAYARHFPAINWLTSYSLYVDSLKPWYEATFGEEYMANRDKAMSILQQESELQEIVRLVGQDALSPADRLTMETAKMIREDFLQQNAFVDIDSYSEYRRQFLLLGLILHYDAECRDALEKNAPMQKLFAIPARVDIGRAKSVPSDEYEQVYAKIAADMTAQIKEIIAGGEEQ